MIALAIWTVLIANWIGVTASNSVGQNRWARIAFGMIGIAGAAACWLAFVMHANRCAGEEYSIARLDATFDLLGDAYALAWIGTALLSLSLGFSAAMLIPRRLIAFAIGTLATAALFGLANYVLAPGFFSYCAPTPVID